MLDVIIIGAGPYGLSLAAHAKEAGLNYALVGYPMEFWQKKMPPQMFIRTNLENIVIPDPKQNYTLNHFSIDKKVPLSFPLPRTTFVDYGRWYIEKTAIHVMEDYVKSIMPLEKGYEIQTEKGKTLRSRGVVIAVGLTNAKYIPDHLRHFNPSILSHSSDHTQFSCFKGKRVLVLGGGQSAWETAALLHESGAEVDLVYRRASRIPPLKELSEKQKYFAEKFYYLHPDEQKRIRDELEIPTVSDFLVPMVEGKVRQWANANVIDTYETSGGKLRVMFQGGQSLTTDHFIAATGFRFSLDRLPFLHGLEEHLKTEPDGTPKVNEHFESSLRGLYFAGPSVSYSHGPTFRFIAGVPHTVKTMIPSIKNLK